MNVLVIRIVVLLSGFLCLKAFAVQASAPKFSPSPGLYPNSVEVRMSSATRDAAIVYRRDGITPGGRFPGTSYTSPLILSAGDYDFAAVATAPFFDPSKTTRADYQVRNPTLSGLSVDVRHDPWGGAATVSLSMSGGGASIYYTFSSSALLSSNSSLYETPIELSFGTHTLRAFAVRSGEITPILEEEILVSSVMLPDPTIYPGSQVTTEPLTVYIGSTVLGAKIRYTLDGTDPNPSSALYSEPIELSNAGAPKTVEVKARAFLDGYVPSSVETKSYEFEAPIQLPAPTIYPGDLSTTNPVTVYIGSTVLGAEIRYTMDGTDPTQSSALYSEPIEISEAGAPKTVVVKAVVFLDGYLPSEVSTTTYEINSSIQLPSPSIFPGSGFKVLPMQVYLGSTVLGASIHYTMDGSTPTTDSPVYDEAIAVNSSVEGFLTIKAIAVLERYVTSKVSEVRHTFSRDVFPGYVDFYLPANSYSPEQREWNADPDGDGVATGVEYGTGTRPDDPLDFPRFQTRHNGSVFAVRYPKAPQRNDVELFFEWSPDGLAWSVVGGDANTALNDQVLETNSESGIQSREIQVVPLDGQEKMMVRLKARHAP